MPAILSSLQHFLQNYSLSINKLTCNCLINFCNAEGVNCRLQVAGAGCRCRLQVAGCDYIFFQTEDVWPLYGTFLLKFLQENPNCFICKETLVMRNLNWTRLLVWKFAEPFQCVLADTPHSQFGMEILDERCGLIVNYWQWSIEAIMEINRHPL